MQRRKVELRTLFRHLLCFLLPNLTISNSPEGVDARAFHVFGPKLIAMRHSFDDQTLESGFLPEEMGKHPLRAGIAINLPDCHEDEAYALRCKLLAFRFETLDATTILPDCYDPSVSPRANQVMAPLLSVVRDQTLKESVLARMHASESAIVAERYGVTTATSA